MHFKPLAYLILSEFLRQKKKNKLTGEHQPNCVIVCILWRSVYTYFSLLFLSLSFCLVLAFIHFPSSFRILLFCSFGFPNSFPLLLRVCVFHSHSHLSQSRSHMHLFFRIFYTHFNFRYMCTAAAAAIHFSVLWSLLSKCTLDHSGCVCACGSHIYGFFLFFRWLCSECVYISAYREICFVNFSLAHSRSG